jgi:hypothetical protein
MPAGFWFRGPEIHFATQSPIVVVFTCRWIPIVWSCPAIAWLIVVYGGAG